jgi:tetratricopeptide (TPR) repeat protein
MKEFAPDSVSAGVLIFFLGVSASAVQDFKSALAYFGVALSSPWSSLYPENQIKCLLARGKVYQILGDNANALANFTEIVQLDPEQCHALFRRAWVYKVLCL